MKKGDIIEVAKPDDRGCPFCGDKDYHCGLTGRWVENFTKIEIHTPCKNYMASKQKITILVACDDNRLIGKNGALPWNVPEDLKLFKARTLSKVVIMGKNTWRSLPNRPLPDRINIVVSQSMAEKPPVGTLVAKTLEEAIVTAHKFNLEIYIIGGAQLYKAALEAGVVDRIVVSKIHGKYEGDVYFPELTGNWTPKLSAEYEKFDLWEYTRN